MIRENSSHCFRITRGYFQQKILLLDGDTLRKIFNVKRILIAGGGDSALDWGNDLSSIADVTLIHRRKEFRAAPKTVSKMLKLEKLYIRNSVQDFYLLFLSLFITLITFITEHVF